MNGGGRLSFASFAIELGPDDARPKRCIDEEVVDAHAIILVEIARAIVPPCVPARLGMAQPVSVDKTSAEETPERFAFRFRDMCSAVARGGIPHVDIFRRDI